MIGLERFSGDGNDFLDGIIPGFKVALLVFEADAVDDLFGQKFAPGQIFILKMLRIVPLDLQQLEETTSPAKIYCCAVLTV